MTHSDLKVPLAPSMTLSVVALAKAGACFFPPEEAQLAIPAVPSSVPKARYSFLIARPAMTLKSVCNKIGRWA